MMKVDARCLFASGCGFLLLTALPLTAQDTTSATPAAQVRDSATLVFEREVFFYPQYERRNPFTPLLSGEEGAPRFEGLQILGIITSPNPAESVALLGPKADRAQGAGAVRTYRVRSGDRLGNIRIMQIQETRIIVEIEEFGMTEQRIMELQRPGQGGLS